MNKTLTASTIFSLLFLFFSCGDSNKNTTNQNTDTKTKTNTGEQTKENKPTEQPSHDPENQNEQNSNGIRIQFPTGSTQVTLNGNIKGLGDNITYVFEVSQGQKLTASVKPAKGNGNIRFNQIFPPTGNADGPFGNEMTYNLNQSGNWRLVVGESNMLGEPYVGEYMLTIEIK